MNRSNGQKRMGPTRLAAAAVLSAALLVPLGVFGGTSFAKSSAAAGQYKITICHHTHSKKNPTVTIRISIKAWPAHQRHGDTLGPCAQSKPHGKHNATHGKSAGKPASKPATTQGQTQSGTHAQSGDHANDHANDHAKKGK